MSSYIDETFLLQVSSKLERFKKLDDHLYNFRCNYCGDSKKNKYKARGHFFEHKDMMVFKCHNCGHSCSFNNFLKDLDSNIHKEYLLYKFKGSKQIARKEVKKAVIDDYKFDITSLVSIESLPQSHHARKYLEGRLIPKEFFGKLFYTDNYQKWVKEYVDASKYPNEIAEIDERIVIPFYKKNGEPFAFQGRALDPKATTRYITVKTNDLPLIYGFERVDLDKPIRLCEGPFDSLFVDNCLAAAGSSLSKMIKSDYDTIFIFDNEPRSPEIIKLMGDVIKLGKKIVIWPNNILVKDINNMVELGVDVEKVITKNTFTGLTAQLKFKQWKKV